MPAASSRRPARPIAQALDCRPGEVVFTSGGTEADNLALKGVYWSRRAADPRRTRILATAIEHHAVLDPLQWLEEAEGAAVWPLAVDSRARLDVDALRAAVERDPGSVALISVMWANNEVGTLQPIDEVVAIAAEHGIPVHTDAVQAVGAVPVAFARSGVDALTLSGHKVGGPFGVGALVVRRELAVTPLVHGGGQERDIRSGTIDPPAIAGFAAAVELAVKQQADHAERVSALRDDLVRRIIQAVPDAHLHGASLDSGERLPGNAHLGFPGCEGDSLLMLLDARGIECSTGSACSAGVPQPSHVLLAMGCDEEAARHSLRFTLGHTSTQADVDAVVEAIVPVVERARAARAMRVVAAMSGGVDSAVAAARAVEAGHDVTGIHLALSRNPASYRSGARGCCTIEDANDARRAADVIGIPFYVWDLSERFHEDVVVDFMDEYAAGRTPNPCLRCNEKIKFEAVLDRALALGFDAVATGHYAQLRTGDDGLIEMHRAVDHGKDQSYVLGVLDQQQLAHSLFPLGDSTKADVRLEAAARGLLVADKPDSHDICFVADGDNAGWLREKLGDRAPNHGGDILDEATGEVLGQHEGTVGFTIGQRKGLRIGRPAPDGKPRFVLDIEPVSGAVTVGPRERLAVARIRGVRPRWCGSVPTRLEGTVQLRAHGDEHRAVVAVTDDAVEIELLDPAYGIAPGQAAVLYDGSRVVGSATIEVAERVSA